MGVDRWRTLCAWMLVAVAALLAAGCTPRQSREQYEERLSDAVTARAAATDKLDSGSLVDEDDYDAEADSVLAALDGLVADAPPRDLQDAHEPMMLGMEGLAALLQRLGRCEALGEYSAQDKRACRQSIGQAVYDEIRNDFTEADTIYREEGVSVPGLGGDDGSEAREQGGDTLDGGGASTEGEDEL
jgi:hypothetical protein